MQQEIKIRYINEILSIGMVNWKEVYLLKPVIIRLLVEVDNGRLIYRRRGSNTRISYNKLKKGLKKKEFLIFEDVPDWLINYRITRKALLAISN